MKQFMRSFQLSPQERSARSRKRVESNLGVIHVDRRRVQVYSSEKAALLSDYYHSKQYDHLRDWHKEKDAAGQHIPIHQRKPKIIFPFLKNLSSRVTAKLIGKSVFPILTIPDSPNEQEFLNAIIEASRIKAKLLEPMRLCLATGGVFLRFKLSGGAYSFEHYEGKFCYPEFKDQELERMVVKYIYEDPSEKDSQGNPKMKWYKAEYNTESEIIYDNPDFDKNSEEEPEFKVVSEFHHGLGFVQGEYLQVDDFSLGEDILGFIDEICYSISQSSRAIAYNQDPQLFFKNMTEEEISEVVRSASKSWNLGRDGEAGFVESAMEGVKTASDFRDKVKHHIGDLARIVLLDPDKVVGSAQSAKAMEVLYAPMIDLIDELRLVFEPQIKSILTKLSLLALAAGEMGIDAPIRIPKGWAPEVWSIVAKWPEIFKKTFDDIAKKVGIAANAANANIISRKTATKYVAEDFGIEDIEAEHAEIAAQPVFNPFGSF